MDEDQRLKNEKEALGFFLTSHPLQPFSREMRRLRLTTLEDARDLYPKAELSTAVLVVSLKEVITKSKSERMACVGVEDLTGHAEVTFFPRAYAEARELLKSEQPLCLRATVDSQVDESRDSDEDGEETSREVKLLGQSVTLLSEACGQSDTPICVQIPAHRLGDEDILALKAILEAHPGTVEAEAMILLDGVRCHLTLGPQFRVSPGPELDRALAAWAGSPRTLLGQRTMSIAWAGLGVLSLLAAAGIYFVAQKMRRGAPILTAWAVVPGFACCLWIMANYYQSWAEEPVLGQYLIPMLGALLSMIACFLVGGFAFGKARVTLTLTVCLAAGAFNIMALADGLPLADTALYLGMMFYLLSMAAALARNDAKPEAPPACAPNCAGCPGCAPMGTQGGQPPAGTDGQTPDQPQ